MPIVTITVRGPKSREFKAKAFSAVHGALVGIGVRECHQLSQVMAAARWMAPRKLQAVLS